MTVFLALHEAFKTKPVSQSKKQFLNEVTSIMKKGNMISSSLKEEHEVWNVYEHCWIEFLKQCESKTYKILMIFKKSILF